jgi:hypothetical protein
VWRPPPVSSGRERIRLGAKRPWYPGGRARSATCSGMQRVKHPEALSAPRIPGTAAQRAEIRTSLKKAAHIAPASCSASLRGCPSPLRGEVTPTPCLASARGGLRSPRGEIMPTSCPVSLRGRLYRGALKSRLHPPQRRGALKSRHKLSTVAARLSARRRAKIVPTFCPASLLPEARRAKIATTSSPASLRGEIVPTSCRASLRGEIARTSCPVSLRGEIAPQTVQRRCAAACTAAR